jgi:hypothetical protein
VLAVIAETALSAIDGCHPVFAVRSTTVLVVKVNIHAVTMSAFERAEATRLRHFVRVDKLVGVEIGGLCEGSVALVTFVGLLSGVLKHMIHELPASAGFVVALFTCVRLCTSMGSGVGD